MDYELYPMKIGDFVVVSLVRDAKMHLAEVVRLSPFCVSLMGSEEIVPESDFILEEEDTWRLNNEEGFDFISSVTGQLIMSHFPI